MLSRRLGWALWLLGAACLYFFENNGGTRAVLCASVLAPLLSLFAAGFCARRLSARLEAPKSFPAGGQAACRLHVQGPRLLGLCAGSGRIVCRVPLTGESSMLEVPLARGSAECALAAERCGGLYLSLEGAELRDWFGLWRIPVALRAEAQTLAIPEIEGCAIELLPTAPEGREETGGLRRSQDPEGGEVRPYRPGDPLRRIHWKLSARVDETLVRQTPAAPAGGILLLLETALERPDPENTDQTARALLGASYALLALGEAHAVAWFDQAQEAFLRFEVACEEDFFALRARLLASGTGPAGEGIAAGYVRAFPEERFAHIALFSPHAAVQTAELLARQTITLVLPRGAAYAGAESGLRVCTWTGKGAWLAL